MFYGPGMIWYLILVGPALLFALYAQMRTKSAFSKYSRIGNSSNMTGAQAAATMLRGDGFQIVNSADEAQRVQNALAIERIGGFLSDHYDPRSKVLRLSPDVYDGRSLAAVGVACHEAGHALQHAHGYAALQLRSMMVPVANIGSNLGVILVMLGLIGTAFMGNLGYIVAQVGLLLFLGAVIFTIVTLPVEFNASTRAKQKLLSLGIISQPGEREGVAAVLDAAALTYVAAAASAIATFLYYALLVFGGRRE